MGKSAPSAPPPPDPAATAAAQSAANIDTAIAQGYINRTNQTSPFGTSTYNQTGTVDVNGHAVPQFEQTVTLSPAQQAMLDKTTAIGGQLLDLGQGRLTDIGNAINQPLDFSNLPPTLTGAYGVDPRSKVEDALYQRATSRLDPEWASKQDQFETQISNQGFTRGSEGFTRAVDDFMRGRNDAYAGARQQSIIGGGQEQSRQQALNLSERQQALQELLTSRAQPINELATLMGTSGGVTMPQFQAPPQTGVGATDVIGSTLGSAGLSNQQAAQQAQMAAAGNSSAYSAATALAIAAMMASDKDVKTDMEAIDTADVLQRVEDLPVESWRYKGDPVRRIGPYAQDWAEKFGGDGRVIMVPEAFGVSLGAIKELAKRVKTLEARAN